MENTTNDNIAAIKQFRKNDSLSNTVDYAHDLMVRTRKISIKPTLNTRQPTPAQLVEYTTRMTEFEKQKDISAADREANIKHNAAIDAFIINMIKEEAGLFDISKQYQDKVYAHAYQCGHDEGIMGVYNHLTDLVDIFN